MVPSPTLSTVGGRAFPVAGHTIWNNLPDNVTSAQSLSTFSQRTKTSSLISWRHPAQYLIYSPPQIRNELHWLAVHKRIVYKLCLLVFKCQHEQAPIYLSSLCSPLSAVTTRRQLRATTQGDLDYPRRRTVTYGSRAFAVSRPTCWNYFRLL